MPEQDLPYGQGAPQQAVAWPPARSGLPLRLGSLLFLGLAQGTRLARLTDARVAAVVTAASVLLVVVILLAFALATRRRVARVRAATPGAPPGCGVTMPAVRPGRRPRAVRVPFTLVVLPDRLVLVPATRRRVGPDLDVPLSTVTSATWGQDLAGVRRVPQLLLNRTAGGPLAIRFDGGLGNLATTTACTDAAHVALTRSLPQQAVRGHPPATSTSARWGHTAVVAGMCLSIVAATGVGYLLGTQLVSRTQRSAVRVRPGRETGVPGYYTYGGPRHLPLERGAPWGVPCSPVLLRVAPSVPDPAYAAFAEVAQEARQQGLVVAVTHRDGTFDPAALSPPGRAVAGAFRSVEVYVDTTPTGSPGAYGHYSLGWDAALAPDGRHEVVTDLQQGLRSGLSADGYRRAALHLVGYSQGIDLSTARGSALGADFDRSADAFSAQDVHAMLAMSGCAAAAG